MLSHRIDCMLKSSITPCTYLSYSVFERPRCSNGDENAKRVVDGATNGYAL